MKAEHETPAAKWRANNEPDPHGESYNCTRGELIKGELTDDELANEFFLYDHRGGFSSAMWLCAAKDRIRWLSRRLCDAEAELAALKASDDKPHAEPSPSPVHND